MPRLSPCSRSDFIRKFRNLGYQGPVGGGDHQFMSKRGHGTVKVPNPHSRGGEISVDLLSKVLRDAHVSRDEWMNA
ncbi:type II toxin-antitoxin system HicA family toxin [Candidatus Binatus sp.]|uniref:type II toxin-antitoxin system HicA family toxin n=1 Tax=Candidatus Binatus sp. TaxID=2811406 RepID=UPI003C222F23